MSYRERDTGKIQWKSTSCIHMENSSDNDEESKNLNARGNVPMKHATRPARIFYDGDETSPSCSNVAEFTSGSFQKSRGSKYFQEQHSVPSRRSRGTYGNQRRGRSRGRNQMTGNFRSNFYQHSSHLSQKSYEAHMSVNSNENPQLFIEQEHFSNSANVDKIARQVNETEVGGSFSGTFSNAKKNLDKFMRLKEEYDSMRRRLSPEEIIMDFRKEIEKMSVDCTKHHLDKVKRIEALMQEQPSCSQILKLHRENLSRQQKCFDDFINSVKRRYFALNNINDNNTDNIINEIDKIKFQLENECSLFQRKLPAYAYKDNISNALKYNQVIIISADWSYFFNTATPIIAMSELYDYFIVSCESSNISCEWIKYDVESLITYHTNRFSGINFMNIEEMLNYLKNSKASEKNCFILNLLLKRSINSDLLLATLNKVISQQKNSKLVLLLSIYDNVKVYQTYFSSHHVFLLEVPKLLFPVKTVWKNEPLILKNYKENVVQTVLSIHTSNNPGDVLAFLPNLADAGSVHAMLAIKIEELNYDDLECILLHEDSTNILDFKKPLNREEKRKIFLVTQHMEAIPLPSVLYVVDCGLLRDYIFDKSKNLDVLTTTFNSRARANLRESLVGAYTTGICYRICSETNFCNDMQSYELPDLLTLNTLNTLIKIFHHYPEKALSLQFVEPLTDAITYNTIKQLKKFNIIKDGTLTHLGRKIAKLPFSARYSKLILQGIQRGFSYEAVILVSYFSVDSFLFTFTKDEKYRKVIDATKLDLMQHESDALSFLQVFKSWRENNYSIAWCKKFQINCNTLNKVKTKISEICHIVYENLNENIIQEFSDLENSFGNILEMLFQCFSDNLCVFSGHSRFGYRILSSPETADIHSSSIICNKENLPQLIIYDKIIRTSRYFLLGITAVPTDLVLKGLADKTLEYEYSDIFEKTLNSETIEPVGERIIKQVLLGVKGKKLQEIENAIKKKAKNDYIVIDPCIEKGCVNVYAPQPILKDVVSMVNQILKSNLTDVINAEATYILELQKDDMVIPLEIKCVMGAKITSVKVSENTQSSLSTNDSKKVVSGPLKDNTSSIKNSINLTWTRRACNGECYVTCESFKQAETLKTKRIFVLQNEANAEVNSRNKAELLLTGLSEETRQSDVEAAIKKHLPNITIENIKLRFKKPFETTSKDIEEMKMEIKKVCDECNDLIDCEIIIPKPKNTATIMTAYINVFGSNDLTSAAEKLSNIMIKSFKVTAIPVYSSVIRVSYRIFEALELRIEEEVEKLKVELSKIFPERDLFRFKADHISDTNLVVFKLHSNDIKIMKQLQRTINELLEGEVLNKNQVKDIHKLFCHGGHMWLRTLEKSEKVHIIEEYNSKTIRIYGSRENCFKVKECILNFLKDTENEAVESITLSNDKHNRSLMKSLIKEYSVHLEKFVELCTLRSAELDIRTCRLLLHGSRDSINKAKEVLKSISSTLDSTQEYSVLIGGELCPVCSEPAFNLTVRLQHCNHVYCRDCILMLLEQAHFPIQCCAENCSKQDILLDDIIKILDEDDVKIKKLLRASLDDYLKYNQSEIFCCPAPDCPMFAYKKDIYTRWTCPLCRNEICTKCNVVYHHGYTCDLYQGSMRDPTYSLKIWKKGAGVEFKHCPRCNAAIEKNGGCNHMACILCKAHFCWFCCREFDSAQKIYNHIPFCRGENLPPYREFEIV